VCCECNWLVRSLQEKTGPLLTVIDESPRHARGRSATYPRSRHHPRGQWSLRRLSYGASAPRPFSPPGTAQHYTATAPHSTTTASRLPSLLRYSASGLRCSSLARLRALMKERDSARHGVRGRERVPEPARRNAPRSERRSREQRRSRDPGKGRALLSGRLLSWWTDSAYRRLFPGGAELGVGAYR